MGQQILLVVHILLAIAIIGLILLQHGKGAEAGAAFGGGASQTLFGSRGSASFLTKLTAFLAVCFAVTSLSIGYMATHRHDSKKSLLKQIEEVQKAQEVPIVNPAKDKLITDSHPGDDYDDEADEVIEESDEMSKLPKKVPVTANDKLITDSYPGDDEADTVIKESDDMLKKTKDKK